MNAAKTYNRPWEDNGTLNLDLQNSIYGTTLTDGDIITSTVFVFAGIRFRLPIQSDGQPQGSLVGVDNNKIRITFKQNNLPNNYPPGTVPGGRCVLTFNGQVLCSEDKLRPVIQSTNELLAHMVDAKATNRKWLDGDSIISDWATFA
jgi:hypothetical protein